MKIIEITKEFIGNIVGNQRVIENCCKSLQNLVEINCKTKDLLKMIENR